MKRYCKNEKPFVYAVFSEKDKEQAISVLEKISESGVCFWFPEQFSKKKERRAEAAFSFILFISHNSAEDENVWRIIDAAVKYNKKILCIYLEQTTLSPGKKLRMGSTQLLSKDAFSDEQSFQEKLKSAEVFSDMNITDAQKKFTRRRALASVFVPLAAAAVIFFAVVVPLLILPASVPVVGALSRIGYGNMSAEELAKIDKLYIAGSRTFEDNLTASYSNETKSEVWLNELKISLPTGDINNVSDIAFLTNAKYMAIEANQVSDISPLYRIKTLERLNLNCNPVASLAGIDALQNLKELSIAECSGITDLTPLLRLPNLKRLTISPDMEQLAAEQLGGATFDIVHSNGILTRLGMGNRSLDELARVGEFYAAGNKTFDNNLTVSYTNETKTEVLLNEENTSLPAGDISDISDVALLKNARHIAIEANQVSDISPLYKISTLERLHLNCNPVASLEGIDALKFLTELNIADCSTITDLTPLLKLPNLKRLTISPDMEDLAAEQLSRVRFDIVHSDGALTRLGLGNLSLDELTKIDQLFIIANKTYEEGAGANYRNETKTEVRALGLDITVPVGDISDISDLALLKSAMRIAVEGNKVSDITSLFKLKQLETLLLNCNPIRSIKGIEALRNLREVDLTATDVRDISPLFNISSLEKIDFSDAPVSSIEGIEKLKHLRYLGAGGSDLADISPLNNMDFSYINDLPEGEGFDIDLRNSRIADFSPLQNIPKFGQIIIYGTRPEIILPFISNKQVYELDIERSDLKNFDLISVIRDINILDLSENEQFTSIDGIEAQTSLKEINLSFCPNLTDLTPLLKLSSLERLKLSPDMEDRAKEQLSGASFDIEYEG